ncbi:hypothetical protein DP49_5507 [Burkholderia pseudomallei]|nr:hypothetical protein DP49_5507 [Burkholderia pseudomallei]
MRLRKLAHSLRNVLRGKRRRDDRRIHGIQTNRQGSRRRHPWGRIRRHARECGAECMQGSRRPTSEAPAAAECREKLLVVNTGVRQCPLIPFSGPRAAPAAKRRTCAPPLAHPPPAATAVAFALSPDAAARPASIHAHAPASPIPPIAACAPAHAFACGRRRGCSDPRSAFEQCLAVPVVPCRASSTSKQQR